MLELTEPFMFLASQAFNWVHCSGDWEHALLTAWSGSALLPVFDKVEGKPRSLAALSLCHIKHLF